MAFLYIEANVHNFKGHAVQLICMSSSATQTGGNQIKRIPVKELTWVNLYDLKEAGQSYDELLAGMIQRERDYRDWRMINEIDRTGEFVAFDPEEIMKSD
jgi:hypothetical protein